MKNENFQTSYGRRINFYPGYKEKYQVLSEKQVLSMYQDTEEHVAFYSFMKDAFEYGLMIDYLAQHGLKGPWKSALDLGGAEGTVSRLLKSEKLVERADCLDIKDFSNTLPNALYNKYLLKFRVISMLNKFGFKKPSLKANFPEHFNYSPNLSDKYYNIQSKAPGRIDNYYTSSIYEHTEKYDLISALLCFPYFDLRLLFPRISSMLKPGGVFYFITDYWWSQVNSSQIVGEFPYASQRLTKEDLIRYFEINHPEEVSAVDIKYDYYHCGMPAPVVDTYCQLGRDNGMELIGIQRQITQSVDKERIFITPQDLERDQRTKLDDVIQDIHQFRNDVKVEDLKTAFVIGAFVKK